jgi:hypothetical protein
MLTTYATGLAVIVAVTLAWVGVQCAWRRVFADICTDPDALAGRMGCHGCARQRACRRRPPEPSESAEEGIS